MDLHRTTCHSAVAPLLEILPDLLAVVKAGVVTDHMNPLPATEPTRVLVRKAFSTIGEWPERVLLASLLCFFVMLRQ